jgi:hypothetical protein
MIHARKDYNRIQDPGLENPDLICNGATPIAADEPVFLLRAQDETAAAVVRFWAALNSQGDPMAVELALEHARKMDAWPRKKTADV